MTLDRLTAPTLFNEGLSVPTSEQGIYRARKFNAVVVLIALIGTTDLRHFHAPGKPNDDC